MPIKYPFGMTFTQWRRTPFRTRHRLMALTLNNHFRYWRSCEDARCRRARACQDYLCYWRQLHKLPIEEAQRVRTAAEPLAKLLWIGSSLGAEGRQRF